MQTPARPTQRALANSAAIAAAARALRAGGLVAMPTETVYGLAGLATSDAAVAAIYAAKGRPAFNPLISHFADLESAAREALFDERALRLARAFWPGPLTLVAPAAPGCRISLLARAGLDSLALRVPRHEIARALIAAAGAPLAAPSANRSGRVSPTSADHVAEDLDGRIDWILDGGPAALGLESTIVACLGGPARLLRHGALAPDALEAALGEPLLIEPLLDGDAPEGSAAPQAPGMLLSHYAPRAALRMNANEVRPGEAALDFAGALAAASGAARLDLSPSGDLQEAAANLFAHMRALDSLAPAAIAAAPIPLRGLGLAINDRLQRAAAPRAS